MSIINDAKKILILAITSIWTHFPVKITFIRPTMIPMDIGIVPMTSIVGRYLDETLPRLSLKYFRNLLSIMALDVFIVTKHGLNRLLV